MNVKIGKLEQLVASMGLAMLIFGSRADLFPTLLDLAGITKKPKHYIDGVSL